MKHIIRYMLEGDGSVPKFVEDGGYFPKDNEMIGISIDDSKRFLPNSVIKMNRDDLIVWAEGLTEEDEEEVVDAFLESKGL